MSAVVSYPYAGVRSRTIAAVVATVAAVALPQILHVAGTVTGAGPAFAAMWLPMFLPVMLVGLLAGPLVAALVGAVAPLLSLALTGMPALGMVPFVMVELVVAGVVAGLVSGRLHLAPGTVLTVFSAPVALLVARYAVALFTGGLAGAGPAWWAQVSAGLPGILLQVVVIALTLRVINRR
ncbi:MAG: hypothetical protein LBI33_02415 [Propionibacteriaceae bacterium]|jgi:LytS/YehU family sensor histidine kinase|nr:hypothetical protein [Propionibacteriaceae bacterium]